jgi:hypothetical protein
MTKEYRLAEIPMPELMDEDPRSAPPTVAAPKTESVDQNGSSADAVGTVTTLERPSSRDVLELEPATASCVATAVAVTIPSAGLPVPAPAASATACLLSEAEALLDASSALKHKPSAASLPASIDVETSVREAFTARSAAEELKLLDRIAGQISPIIGARIRMLFRHPPLILGQAAEEYYELANAMIDELIPYTLPEALLVKQVVDDEWTILTFGSVQRSLLNAAIAAGLIDRLSGLSAGAENQSRENRNHQLHLWRRIVFAAISGDQEMRSLIERHVGEISFDAFAATRLVDDIRAHVFTDNVRSAALKRRNDAMRDLEKMRRERHKEALMRADDMTATEKGNSLQAFALSLINRKESKNDL